MDNKNDNAFEAFDKALNGLFNQQSKASIQQQLCDSIKNAHERITQLQGGHDRLYIYVHSVIYNELEKCKKQYAELRNHSLTTVESVNEYMNAFQLSHYIPSHPKPSTIRVWCCQDKIPHHKMNGKLVFEKSEIDEWLKCKLWEK